MQHILSEDPTYGLVVLGGKVVVLHSWAEPVELNNTGGKFVAFGGDFRSVAGQTVNPDLYHVDGSTSRTNHATHFTHFDVDADTWDDISTNLEANTNLLLVPRSVAPQAGGAAGSVQVHKVLPVPGYIAAIFMKPTPVRAAFERGTELRAIMTDTNLGHFAPLFDFLRAAVTAGIAPLADRSAITSEWVRLTIEEDTPMEVRFFRMMSKLKTSDARIPVPAPANDEDNSTPEGRVNPAKDTDKHKYHDFQLHRIWSAAGENPASFAVLTEAALPPFFKGLREVRSNSAAARNYIEAEWATRESTERFETPFTFSKALVTDLRNLEFGGQDTALSWETRGRGLSYYSLGPADFFASGRHISTTDDWRLMEATEYDGTMTLSERRSCIKTSELLCETPKERLTTIVHLEAVADRFTFFMTKNCPVVKYLTWFAYKITTDRKIQHWNDVDFLAFNWFVHTALRHVWLNCDNGITSEDLVYLVRIQNDLKDGRKFPIGDCPSELQKIPKRPAEEMTSPVGGPGKKVPKVSPEGATTPQSSPIASNFTSLVAQAKANAKNKKNFKIAKLLPKQSDYYDILGPQFMDLVDGNPCGRFFLHQCSAKDCHFNHTLKSNPTKAVIEGMVKRMTEKVAAFIASELSKS